MVEARSVEGLSDLHRAALEQALTFVRSRYAPWAIVATGTIIRGTPDLSSDIDLCVLHNDPFRQRVQRRFQGVPFEIFVNPEGAILEYLESEARAGRPVTAHMLATGVVL